MTTPTYTRDPSRIVPGAIVFRVITTRPAIVTGGGSGVVLSVKNGRARVQWFSRWPLRSVASHPVNVLCTPTP